VLLLSDLIASVSVRGLLASRIVASRIGRKRWN
jgi:hypothetical protein